MIRMMKMMKVKLLIIVQQLDCCATNQEVVSACVNVKYNLQSFLPLKMHMMRKQRAITQCVLRATADIHKSGFHGKNSKSLDDRLQGLGLDKHFTLHQIQMQFYEI